MEFVESQKTTFADGSNVLLSVTDPGPEATSVAYFKGNQKIAEVNRAPYHFTWTDVADGCFNIRARVKYDGGMTALSDILEITVGSGCDQAPYNDEAVNLPGRVQCEKFDKGGPDVAWFDTTPQENIGGAFRTGEGVDIEECQDSGGGYNVGWAETGEWLEYSVQVQQTGDYKMVLRCAALEDEASFSILVDGEEATGVLNIPSSGGWQNWQNVESGSFQLQAGSHILRLKIESSGANYNYFEVISQ